MSVISGSLFGLFLAWKRKLTSKKWFLQALVFATDRPVTPQELVATIYHALGYGPDTEMRDTLAPGRLVVRRVPEQRSHQRNAGSQRLRDLLLEEVRREGVAAVAALRDDLPLLGMRTCRRHGLQH